MPNAKIVETVIKNYYKSTLSRSVDLQIIIT